MDLNVKALLCAWLMEQDDAPVEKVYTDMFQTDTKGSYIDDEELVCRYDPSAKSVKDFIDGSKLVTQTLSFYARCKSTLKAREWLQWVLDTVDNKRVMLDGTAVDLEAVTLPQAGGIDDRGYAVYTATLSATYNDETSAFEDAFSS